MDLESKIKILDALVRNGFHVNLIGVILNRIEVFSEDLGAAILNSLVAMQSQQVAQQNVENKAPIEQNQA